MYRPFPKKQPTVQRKYRNREIFGPFGKAHCLSVVTYHDIISFVSCVLRFCNPFAIRRLIVSIIVFPIKMKAVWSPTHVSQKTYIGIFPSIANSYSSCAIILICFIFGIKTSPLHSIPYPVLSGSVIFCTISMTFHKFKSPEKNPLVEATEINRGTLKLISFVTLQPLRVQI